MEDRSDRHGLTSGEQQRLCLNTVSMRPRTGVSGRRAATVRGRGFWDVRTAVQQSTTGRLGSRTSRSSLSELMTVA